MSEQKYYVKLEFSSTYLHVGYAFISWDKNKKSCGGYCQTEFTKSELSKIMDGALYREIKDVVEYVSEVLIESNTGWVFTDEILGDIEWINPLIELVPIEGEVNE